MSKLSISNRLTSLAKPNFSRITKSFVQGPSTPPLSLQTFPHFFNNQILPKYGDRPALISLHELPRVHGGPLHSTPRHNLEWNYDVFDRHIQALARGLIGLGVKEGERVGVVMGNSRSVFQLFFAQGLTSVTKVRMQCCNGHVRT